jgi:hypothetical protein
MIGPALRAGFFPVAARLNPAMREARSRSLAPASFSDDSLEDRSRTTPAEVASADRTVSPISRTSWVTPLRQLLQWVTGGVPDALEHVSITRQWMTDATVWV